MTKRTNTVNIVKKRNAKWSRNELILALNLYFELDGHGVHKLNPIIIELSRILNQMSTSFNDNSTFRNANGVALKLSNFTFLDSTRKGGMSSVSKLDKIIFEEFVNSKDILKELGEQIINGIHINPKKEICERNSYLFPWNDWNWKVWSVILKL
jgi:hypothetical protein